VLSRQKELFELACVVFLFLLWLYFFLCYAGFFDHNKVCFLFLKFVGSPLCSVVKGETCGFCY